jgi:uncharacterized UBP type Zn finger protein
MSNYKRCMHVGNTAYCHAVRTFPNLVLLQFQRAVQFSKEDLNVVKNKQEYTLLAIISHKGDTPNSGMFLHDFRIRNLCM